MLQSINKVELVGVVGNARTQNVNGKKYISLALCTNRAYRDAEGVPVIETSWHQVKAFEDKDIADFNRIQRGTALHVIGRIRHLRCIKPDGEDGYVTEIFASRIEIIDDNIQPESEI